MDKMTVKTPWHLWVVGVVALLFNAIGPYDWTRTMLEGASYLASAGMPPEQISIYAGMPLWAKAVWGIAVWAAVIGAVALLLRRRLATKLFAVSLVGFLINLGYLYLIAGAGPQMGQANQIVQVVIAAQLALLIWYSSAMTRKGVLR